MPVRALQTILCLLAYCEAMVKSFARFSPFSRGRIIGKAEEGASRKKIRKEVRKKDGKQASFRAIDGVLQHHRSDPEWQGEDSAAENATSQ